MVDPDRVGMLTEGLRKKIEINSAIAQWWSIRLLTEGLQVRALLAERISPSKLGAFVYHVILRLHTKITTDK